MEKKKRKDMYVNNKQLLECIVEFKAQLKEAREKGERDPQIPKYAGEAIQKIATRMASMPKFSSYSFKEEMISDAILNCVMYFNSFDPEKSNNPFAYFTTVISNAFIRRIYSEKKNRYIIYKYFDTYMVSTDQANLLRDDDNTLIHEPIYDNIQVYIGEFEQKEAEKKKKKQEMKGLQKFYDQDTTDEKN
jgi:hypothetical protein